MGGCDDQTSAMLNDHSETRYGPNKNKKRLKVPDLLSMMHLQAKLIEDQFV